MSKLALADAVFAACTNAAKMVEPSFASPTERRKIGEYMRDRIRTARRFYLDDEVTRAAVTLGLRHPDVLLGMLRRARTPFERIWIEWPVGPQLEEAGIEKDPDGADRAGVLIERLDEQRPLYRMTEVNSIYQGRGEVGMSPLSIVYDLNEPIPREKGVEGLLANYIPMPPDAIRRALVGSGYVGRNDEDSDEEERSFRLHQCDLLTAHATRVFTPVVGPLYQKALDNPRLTQPVAMVLQNAIVEEGGLWRLMVAVLALINSQDYTTTEITRAGDRRFVGGKMVPFLDHHLVRLKLPRRVVDAKAPRTFMEGLPRRRHEVMGHWKHRRGSGDPSCDHVFVSLTDNREVCTLCSYKRWWVNEFERGDSSVGYVLKDRLVTRR